MRHGSLFSGIGGFDLAAQWMGWENMFHCEWNEFAQKVLKYHFPKSISYGDITKTDFTIWSGQIDILTGGFPCQPYSLAGKRKGKEDDRHLWPEMLRAIREIAPRWIIGENVSGLVSWDGGLVFEEVQTDLEAEGYEIWAVMVPACAVNAPHRRDRIWFIAHNSNAGTESLQQGRKDRFYGFEASTNPQSEGGAGLPIGAFQERSEHGEPSQNGDATYTCNTGLQRSAEQRSVSGSGDNGNQQPARLFPPTWENFPTKSPLCTGNDGISSKLDGITFSKWRTESIKAAGNAIIPQVAYEFFKGIEMMEKMYPDRPSENF